MTDVSIHAPRAEGDSIRHRRSPPRAGFNPRPPRGGRRDATGLRTTATMFQSTPPARRATSAPPEARHPGPCFNPRPPRGGRLGEPTVERPPEDVSIHAPRAEGDSQAMTVTAGLSPVSIHAPRAEGDWRARPMLRAGCRFNPRPPRGGRRERSGSEPTNSRFNPRPPRGGRHTAGGVKHKTRLFQSTPPARRATRGQPALRDAGGVSIHAPRAEGDAGDGLKELVDTLVSIHAPRAEGDAATRGTSCPGKCFNPRPPRGGRPARPPASGSSW